MKILFAAGLFVIGFISGYVLNQQLASDEVRVLGESGDVPYPRVLVDDEYGRKIEDLGNGDILGAPTTLRVTDTDGRQVEATTTPVILTSLDAFPQNGYFIVTSGEKFNGGNLDEVTLVFFEEDGPRTLEIISRPGFGELVSGKWIYIQPWVDEKGSEITMQILDGLGGVIDSWQLGSELKKDFFWEESYRLYDMKPLGSNEFVLSFGGDCGIDEPYVVCARYLVNIESKTVHPLPTQPSSLM